ncbi:MAG: ribose-5-phosphate isomerase [Candidatus Parcubacteria bacterium]|nr:MAG: ribose-5-phosphate isomerase [Candidatus Parcubacteria bacterium]
MKIFIGADHRGFELKEYLKEKLKENNYHVEDLGNFVYDPNDDYPDFALEVGERVASEKGNVGILICGSGAGVCFTVNKVKGIRGSLAFNSEMAKKMKADDDINVLCLASDFIDEENAWEIVKAFLETKFKNEEKYLRRIKKVNEYENKNYTGD